VQSSEKLESILAPLKPMFRASAQSADASSEAFGNVLKALGIEALIDRSVELSRESVRALVEVTKSSVFRGSKEVMSFSAAGTLLYSSWYLASHSAEEVVENSAARRLLGYERDVFRQLDARVDRIAALFSLNPAGAEQFKIALANQIAGEAIRTKFSDNPSDYNIDVLDILVKNNLASLEAAEIVREIAQAYKAASRSGTVNTSELNLIAENLEFMSALVAYLQTVSVSGRSTDASMSAEIDRIIGAVSSKVDQIGVLLGKI
jgi:hypothetical protein